MIVYWIFFICIWILVSVVLGLNLSKNIETPIIYFLFWLLYIITILSIINIVMSIYYYFNLKDKRGPSGFEGPKGDQGEVGEVGKCDPNCRESLCTDGITNKIQDYLAALEPDKPIKLNNVFIKQKIKSLCLSPQFQELAPYRGVDALIKYLTEVWKIWIDILYKAGGRIYFETIGAEMEWEWIDTNPYEEIKKYDVFYWGLDKEYWPDVINQCYAKDKNGKLLPAPSNLIKTTTTNNMTKIGDLTGGSYSGTIWRPKNITYEGVNYYPLGDVLVGPNNTNGTLKQKIRYSDYQLNKMIETPVTNTILVGGTYVAPPVDYKLLWNNNKIWIWRPIGPTTDEGTYISLGDIATTSSSIPPINQSAPVRCILKTALDIVKSSQKQIWSTRGTRNPPAVIFGFCPYNGKTAPSSPADTNAYNLFRLALNNPSSIPVSDGEASFYFIKYEYYDMNDQPGKVKGRPQIHKDKQYEGKGWLKGERKDSKYSILAYLNLKPNMNAKSFDNSTRIEMINNTTFGNSNSYVIKYKDRCLEVNQNAVISKLCNFAKIDQCFRVEMTGKNKGEFQLHHINSGSFLQCKSSRFQLVTTGNKETIFYML